MTKYFRVSVTFLGGRFHGQFGDGEPEWPPSPLRLFQAIVAANFHDVDSDNGLVDALQWLERQPPPHIVTPDTRVGTGYVLFVPNNVMDLVAKAYCEGEYFGARDKNPATHRVMKKVRPVELLDDAIVHYLWPIASDEDGVDERIDTLVNAARRVCTLGWGIDMAIADAQAVTGQANEAIRGNTWKPGALTGQTALRMPCEGTLEDLRRRHQQFLSRISGAGFVPVDPLNVFDIVGYQPPGEMETRPHVVFELRNDYGGFFYYPQRKLIHIAGMVRHLAIEAMKNSPPTTVDDVPSWLDRYVAGHRPDGEGEHRQFSYVPLPSIGHRHADQAIRRVMISAPPGDEPLLDHLATRLAGMNLKPEPPASFDDSPTLIRVYHDKVVCRYTKPANTWASVTPVILPGHDDRKSAKTRKLIEKALAQSGINQPCEFEWAPFSRFRNSLSAHKYDRNGQPVFFKPPYLQNLTAVHLTLTFNNQLKLPGPIVIGAGRHCGFGLMAVVD